LNLKKRLENQIRGWLPKEPNVLGFPTSTSRKNVQSRKIKLPIGMMLFFSFNVVMCIAEFLGGNAAGALFLWLSCILGFYLAMDVLVARGKEFNEKSVAGSLLAVISLGGILANVYIFSAPTSLFTRVFSLLLLVLVHVPLLFAVIAYAHGKKELSKRLMGWFSSRR
jgi:peptidoglycan/LPS O-acetylase OafA/YrhL